MEKDTLLHFHCKSCHAKVFKKKKVLNAPYQENRSSLAWGSEVLHICCDTDQKAVGGRVTFHVLAQKGGLLPATLSQPGTLP